MGWGWGGGGFTELRLKTLQKPAISQKPPSRRQQTSSWAIKAEDDLPHADLIKH